MLSQPSQLKKLNKENDVHGPPHYKGHIGVTKHVRYRVMICSLLRVCRDHTGGSTNRTSMAVHCRGCCSLLRSL